MREFKSSDVIVNTIYEEYMRDSIYGLRHISGILIGAVLYSYATHNISHSEFTELIQIIRGGLTE